ncbi:MAG: hypothetical protein LC799_24965 [Actinobacteria bacterium]|nr:hypothetical protein [Actinomycetota bacterium]
MGYGHGLSLSGGSHGKRSEFTTYTWVRYTTQDGRMLRGQVVGPDQNFFPSPDNVFVSFPSTGFTHLVPVTELELDVPASTGEKTSRD